MMLACLWIVCQSTQVSTSSNDSLLLSSLPCLQAVFGPSWNPLDPIYKVLYFLLQVDKPEVESEPSPPPAQRVTEAKPLTKDLSPPPVENSSAISPVVETQRKAKKRAKATGKKLD